jgi:hypothetical protein
VSRNRLCREEGGFRDAAIEPHERLTRTVDEMNESSTSNSLLMKLVPFEPWNKRWCDRRINHVRQPTKWS